MATSPGLDSRSSAYVAEVVGTIDSTTPVREAYLVGSGATGAFDPATSDIDLVAVVGRPLGAARPSLARRLLELECPARDLQLVLYVEGEQPPSFELNLNQGEERPDEDAFWFVLDAALAQEHAVPLLAGRPWTEFFVPVPNERVQAALTESIAWSERQRPDSEFARVNAIRARHYLEHGEWITKEEARR